MTLPSGRTETFGYDAANRFASIGYPEATVAFGYAAGDSTGRIATLTRTPVPSGTAQQIGFAYDASLVSGMTWSGAATGQYMFAYDSNLLLKSAVDERVWVLSAHRASLPGQSASTSEVGSQSPCKVSVIEIRGYGRQKSSPGLDQTVCRIHYATHKLRFGLNALADKDDSW